MSGGPEVAVWRGTPRFHVREPISLDFLFSGVKGRKAGPNNDGQVGGIVHAQV